MFYFTTFFYHIVVLWYRHRHSRYLDSTGLVFQQRGVIFNRRLKGFTVLLKWWTTESRLMGAELKEWVCKNGERGPAVGAEPKAGGGAGYCGWRCLSSSFWRETTKLSLFFPSIFHLLYSSSCPTFRLMTKPSKNTFICNHWVHLDVMLPSHFFFLLSNH